MKKLKKFWLCLAFCLISFSIFNLSACELSFKFKVIFFVDGQTYHTIYTDGNEELTLPDNPEKLGYTFVGWEVDGEDFTSDYLEERELNVNLKVHAKFEAINYSITYHLNGGTLTSQNPTSYTILDEITLLNPTKTIGNISCGFLGWREEGGETLYNPLIISSGSVGDRTYYAVFDDDAVNRRNLFVYVDGTLRDTIDFEIGEIAPIDSIEFDNFGMSGYSVDTWFADFEYQNVFNAYLPLQTDTYIYGVSHYLFDNITFYDYITAFTNAQSSQSITISSHEQLVAYIDFVRFYNINTQVKMRLSYVSNNTTSVRDELESAYLEVISGDNFVNSSSFSQGTQTSQGIVYALFYLSQSSWENQAKNVFDEQKEYVYEQLDYAFKMIYPEERADNFDSFNINNAPKTIPNISTTEQLVWVLENGYAPAFMSNSVAENMYNKAKDILRDICTNDMTDLEKTRAIYEWLVMEVQYDNYASSPEQTALGAETLKTYDSWFVEGVLNNRKAVCEGIAKTFLLLARIEGVPAIFVTGNSHAWNKVYLDGVWYGIDATHGGVEINGQYEMLTYDSFLFTDDYKESKGYATTSFADIIADQTFDFYSYFVLPYASQTEAQQGERHNLVATTQTEVFYLINRARSYSSNIDCDYITIEITSNVNDLIEGICAIQHLSYVEVNSQKDGYKVISILIPNSN